MDKKKMSAVMMIALMIIASVIASYVMHISNKSLGFKTAPITPEPNYNDESEKVFETITNELSSISECDLHAEQIIDIKSDITCKVKVPFDENKCEIIDGKNYDTVLTDEEVKIVKDLCSSLFIRDFNKECTQSKCIDDSIVYKYNIIGEDFNGVVTYIKGEDGKPMNIKASIFNKGYNWVLEFTNISIK